MKIILIAIAVLAFATQGFGLKCWTCDTALTNEECNIKGSIKTCGKNEACINQETTSRDGSSYQITKGCRRKFVKACRVNDPQNQGTYRTTCSHNPKSTVCSCCCERDLCNGPQTECKDMVTCRRPERPGNGKLVCQKPISFGSTCDVVCDQGYRLIGPNKITCMNGTDQGYWGPRESVACLAVTHRGLRKPTMCNVRLSAPEHGSMVCENQGLAKDGNSNSDVGTICAFRCEPGYFRTGPETSQCLPGGRWSVKAPKCKKGMCQKPPQDKNRIDSCSDDNYFGSECHMTCKDGFRLVGNSMASCLSINDLIRQGAWSISFPRCVRAVCRPQIAKPTNGKMACTKRNLLGSVCTFGCKDGYEMTGLEMTINGRVECVQNGQVVEWKGSPPKCTRIMCPRLKLPENGFVGCVGDGRLGTVCSFACNVGYDLVGTTDKTVKSECVRGDRGEAIGRFTVEAVTCAEVRCLPKRTAPVNGQLYCNRENLLGSVCTFTCDPGYDMDGTTAKTVVNICQENLAGDGRGTWSDNPPTCSTKFYCPETQTAPENGEVTCSDGSFLGSVCEFSCNKGYELKGASMITCRDLQNNGDAEVEWSDSTPVCVPSKCPEQWFDRTNMNGLCNREKEGNSYPVGTKCTYECADDRYYMQLADGDEGNGEIRCISKNRWSAASAPRCFVKACPRLPKIENGGQPECTNGHRVASQCRFKCNAKYSLSHHDAVICLSGGRNDKKGAWDTEPPMCILNECLTVPRTPNRGKVECSSGTTVGSYCTLKCDRGFAPRIARVDCQLSPQRVNGKTVEIPSFMNREDFCCAECLSEFHVALAVDAQYQRSLQKVLAFTKIFLSTLAAKNNPVYFSAFSYNTDIDESSTVDKVDIKEPQSLENLLEQMESWEVSEEGRASNTKSALEYAESNVFRTLDSNAANFLIVAADGSPDNVNSALVSRLNQKGINLIVGAGNHFAKIKWEKLLGGGENVVNQDTNEILNRMYMLAFKSGCSNMATKCV